MEQAMHKQFLCTRPEINKVARKVTQLILFSYLSDHDDHQTEQNQNRQSFHFGLSVSQTLWKKKSMRSREF